MSHCRHCQFDFEGWKNKPEVCPNCDQNPGPWPVFPLMTIIPDERGIRIEQDDQELQWHKRDEIESSPTWAWDQTGQRFLLDFSYHYRKIVAVPAESDEVQLFLTIARWFLAHRVNGTVPEYQGDIGVLRDAVVRLDSPESRRR